MAPNLKTEEMEVEPNELLEMSIRVLHFQQLKSALDGGADANRMVNGRTPLLRLAVLSRVASLREGASEMIRLLVAHGCELEARDKAGLTAWMHVSAGRKTISLAAELARICNVEATDPDGNTALHLAIKANRPDVAKVLTECCDVNAQNKQGQTPAHLCFGVESRKQFMPILLQQAGPTKSELFQVLKKIRRIPLDVARVLAAFCKPGLDFSLKNTAGDSVRDLLTKRLMYNTVFGQGRASRSPESCLVRRLSAGG